MAVRKRSRLPQTAGLEQILKRCSSSLRRKQRPDSDENSGKFGAHLLCGSNFLLKRS
ncbi:hypothetical protein AMTRI_Chr09g15820 [Amborella trichopoda]